MTQLFAVFRFIGWDRVGASTIAAPTYISEIAPAKEREISRILSIQYCFGILYISFKLFIKILRKLMEMDDGVEAFHL
jgi:hypothetical protein